MHREKLLVHKHIRHFGSSVDILRRTSTVNDDTGRVVYTYPSTISTKLDIIDLTGYRETWWEIGTEERIDAMGLAYYDATIDTGDIIKLSNNEEYEVVNKIDRHDYLELLLRGRDI